MTQTVLVTGGSGALGGAVVEALLADRWRVVAPARSGATLPEGAEAVPADLTDPAAVAEAVRVAASDPEARLRAVVNLVGGFAAGDKVHQTSIEQFEAMLTLNLRPTYLVTAAALPHLVAAGGGAVVCFSARAATQPFPGAAGYITAKAGVLAFARAVAVEYRDAGVRCNALVPNVIDTPTNRAAMPDADPSGWVQPEAVARVVRFLASDDSAPITGAAIPVDHA